MIRFSEFEIRQISAQFRRPERLAAEYSGLTECAKATHVCYASSQRQTKDYDAELSQHFARPQHYITDDQLEA